MKRRTHTLGLVRQEVVSFKTVNDYGESYFPIGQLCRRSTISVVDLQGVSQENSDSGSERLRLPTASLAIVFYHSSED